MTPEFCPHCGQRTDGDAVAEVDRLLVAAAERLDEVGPDRDSTYAEFMERYAELRAALEADR